MNMTENKTPFCTLLVPPGGFGGPSVHNFGPRPNPEGMHGRKHMHSLNTINQLRIPS